MSHPASPNKLGKPTAVRWVVLAIVAFASASAYLTRYCISAANTTIQEDLGFDNAQMGRLMSAFFVGYLIFQIPGGWLGNRFGTRAAFAALSILWSLCNVGSAVASAFKLMWVTRFSLGLFQAGLVPVSAKIVGDWIPIRARGLSSSMITAAMSLGGAFAMWLTGRLLDANYEWRTIFAAFSLVGIVWSIGFYWYFRTSPADHSSVNQDELALILDEVRADQQAKELNGATDRATARDRESAEQSGDINPFKPPADAAVVKSVRADKSLVVSMLTTRGMWGICIQAFFRSASYTFFVTWFFAFLEYAYGIGTAQAGMLNSLPLMAVVFGSLAGGILVDWLLRVTGSKWISRTGTAFVAMFTCGVLTAASAWTSSATQFSLLIALGAAFSGIAAPAAWAATIDIGGRSTAIVMAVMNMGGNLSAMILPALLGEWFDSIRSSDGDWNLVIYLHAGFSFACALSWLLVNPNHEM